MMLLMISMIILNSIFISLSHPLSMGLMLIIQTATIAIFSGLIMDSFWFSYILILVFLGGLLILFIYVSTLASNEQMSISFPSMSTIILLLFFSALMFSFNSSKIFLFNDNTKSSVTLAWMYSQPFIAISFFLIIYLFIVLIAIVKITKYWVGSLRPL